MISDQNSYLQDVSRLQYDCQIYVRQYFIFSFFIQQALITPIIWKMLKLKKQKAKVFQKIADVMSLFWCQCSKIYKILVHIHVLNFLWITLLIINLTKNLKQLFQVHVLILFSRNPKFKQSILQCWRTRSRMKNLNSSDNGLIIKARPPQACI